MMKIVQVSDLHLLAGGQPLKGFDTTARFRHCVDDIRAKSQVDDELHIIVTGDIAHDEIEDTYREFTAAYKSDRFHWYCIPGNHDMPEYLYKVFPNASPKPTQGFARVRCGDDVDLILLSSHVPGQVHGQLEKAQLDGLRSSQSRPAIVALHHPPISVQDPIFDAMGLRDPERFWEAVAENLDIVGVIFGHAHRAFEGVKILENRDIPALGCPSTCFQYGMNPDQTYGMDASRIGYRWIDYDPECGLTSDVCWLPYSEMS